MDSASSPSAPPSTRSTLPVLHQSYAAAIPDLSVPWQAETPPQPELAWLNEDLAHQLGYDPEYLRSEHGIALLTGQLDAAGQPLAPGDPAPQTPFTTAQVYAGHQFGSPNPQLGDGRAILLGDLVDTRGDRYDLHLKGSGRTPFSRAGDGKAPLGPMLREAVVGEFLHALGTPTTRALAVLTTGERIQPRQGVTPEPGAILVRVAASHLRVGTFEFAAWHHDADVRRALAEYAIDRHHPSARDAENPVLELLRRVTTAQADLIAQWMLAGFVHGVMNTDNMTISGQGIDYGPCAFLDEHRRGAVFSSIDRGGRYAYGNQPGIALWNLSRFAKTLVELIDPEHANAAVDAATGVLEGFEARYQESLARGFAVKLAVPLGEAGREEPDRLREVRVLGEDLFGLLEQQGVDHTLFFRALTEGGAERLFTEPEAYREWAARLASLQGRVGRADAAAAADPADPADPAIPADPVGPAGPAAGPAVAPGAAMPPANPIYIPRNVHLDAALRAAHLGDLGPVTVLLDAVSSPFTRRVGLEHLEGPGDGGADFLTFCGT